MCMAHCTGASELDCALHARVTSMHLQLTHCKSKSRLQFRGHTPLVRCSGCTGPSRLSPYMSPLCRMCATV